MAAERGTEVGWAGAHVPLFPVGAHLGQVWALTALSTWEQGKVVEHPHCITQGEEASWVFVFQEMVCQDTGGQ